MYLAPGLRSPGTRPSPLWCFRFGPRPWRPLTGWSLQPRWPGRGNTVAGGFDHTRGKRRAGFRLSYFSLPPDLVDGSLPPPLIRTVDHVIVHEAGSVDHFWDHSYGSLTREQISEGDGVKGSEMKLGLIPKEKKQKKNRIPLNFCEILDIEQWFENTPASIYDCHINVIFFTLLGCCGCWAPGPSGQLSSVEWPFPCHRNSSRTETWALLWTQKAPAETKTRSHTPGFQPNLKYTLCIEENVPF